ncbi:MAG: hypothetical protein O2865_06315 [Planctomycetota bacterium]|nr:hypothetical protein [Planctomycetota bacterium]
MHSLRHLSVALAALGLVNLGAAQTGAHCLPTVTPFASNNGGATGGAVYLEIDTQGDHILGRGLTVNTNTPAGTSVTCAIYLTPDTYVGAELNPNAWNYAGMVTGVSAGLDAPTVLSGTFCIPDGDWGICLHAVDFAHRYTNGDLAVGPNYSYTDGNITLTLGRAQNGLFVGTPFSPRLANIVFCYDIPVGAPTCASSKMLGDGCGAGPGSAFYQVFDAVTPNDLTGLTMALNPQGPGYNVSPTAAAIVTPTGAGDIGAGDDTNTNVNLPWAFPTPSGSISAITVNANGYIWFDGPGREDFSPSVAELIGEGRRLCPQWEDWQPTGGANGIITAELDPNDPATFHLTWFEVVEFGGVDPNTIQVSFHQNGDIEMKYDPANTVGTGIVGFSTGGNLTDPGATDLSAIAGSLAVNGDGGGAMVQFTDDVPILGARVSSLTTGIPTGSTLGFVGYSFLTWPMPGYLSLASLGAPGCMLIGDTSIAEGFAITGTTHTLAFTVPNNPILSGNPIYSQMIVFAPGRNALGAVTSNGVRWLFGEN